MKKIKIGGLEETVVERSDYPMEKVQKILEKETICTIGYGVQGHGQSLNLRDNGIEVIIGQRRGRQRVERCDSGRLGAGEKSI